MVVATATTAESTTATVSIARAVTTVATAATALATGTATATVAAPTLSLVVATAATTAGGRNLLESIGVSGGSRLSSRRSGNGSVLGPALGAGSGSRLVNGLSLSRVTRDHLEAFRKRVIGASGLGVPLIRTSGVCGTIVNAGGRNTRGFSSGFAVRGRSLVIKLSQAGVGNCRVGADSGIIGLRRCFGFGDLLDPSLLGGKRSIIDGSLLDLGI